MADFESRDWLFGSCLLNVVIGTHKSATWTSTNLGFPIALIRDSEGLSNLVAGSDLGLLYQGRSESNILTLQRSHRAGDSLRECESWSGMAQTWLCHSSSMQHRTPLSIPMTQFLMCKTGMIMVLPNRSVKQIE